MEYRYLGERNSIKNQNIAETVEYILTMQYGSTVSNDKLAKILGYNLDDDNEYRKYKGTMGRVKSFLQSYGYILRNISGIGYYILRPSEISRHCYNTYIKKAARTYDKSLFVLDHVDKLELTTDRLEELAKIKELNRQLIESVDKVLTESVYYDRKAYWDSLKD